MRWTVVVLWWVTAATGCAYEVHTGRPPDAPVPDAAADAHLDTPFDLDPTFGTNGTVEVPVPGWSSPFITLLNNGAVVVSMMVPPASSSQPPTFAACRIQSDGALDPGFGVGGCITRDWWGSARQVAADGDAILVAANRPEAGVSRILANGLDDSTYGTNGALDLTPSGFGSDVVASRVWRLADGSHAVSGSGTYVSASGPAAWLERVQGGAATATSFVFEGATVTEVLEEPVTLAGGGARFVMTASDSAGHAGTRTRYTSPDWATTYSDVFVPYRLATYSAVGFRGLYHVQPFMSATDLGGFWRQTGAGAADPDFGVIGLALKDTPVSAIANDPGGYTYAATGGSSSRLYRVWQTGEIEGEASGLVSGLAINDVAMPSTDALLIVGMKAGTLVVQRFVLHPEIFVPPAS
jgi:hypothetical protein